MRFFLIICFLFFFVSYAENLYDEDGFPNYEFFLDCEDNHENFPSRFIARFWRADSLIDRVLQVQWLNHDDDSLDSEMMWGNGIARFNEVESSSAVLKFLQLERIYDDESKKTIKDSSGNRKNLQIEYWLWRNAFEDSNRIKISTFRDIDREYMCDQISKEKYFELYKPRTKKTEPEGPPLRRLI